MSLYSPLLRIRFCFFFFFFFNDTATTEIYTLSLHDALPICFSLAAVRQGGIVQAHANRPTLRSFDQCHEEYDRPSITLEPLDEFNFQDLCTVVKREIYPMKPEANETDRKSVV